jgi:hypothetical protein
VRDSADCFNVERIFQNIPIAFDISLIRTK